MIDLTPAQRAAITTLTGDVCVDAGAGSGKTFVLIQRIIHILRETDTELDQIVAITFTDLAASEMKERLRREFKKIAESESARNDPNEQSRWRELERRAETARISTIHSFCGSLVRENALRCGLDPDFQVLTEAETALLREEAIRAAVHELLEAEDAHLLMLCTEHRLADIEDALDGLLSNQGAMRGMADRVPLRDPKALLKWWRDQESDLITERVQLMGRSRKARRYLRALQRCMDQSADAGDARVQYVGALIAALKAAAAGDVAAFDRCLAGFEEYKGKRWKDSAWGNVDFDALKQECKNAHAFIEGIREVQISDDVEQKAAALTSAFYHVYEHAAAAYREAKNNRNAQDFDDLILQALDLLEDETSEVLGRARRRIRYLLIDEFQDTDSVQYQIARFLSAHDDGPRLFLVGDAKQSIYGWRGAEVEVFQGAKLGMDRDPIKLDTNFRTVPDVLHFANDFFTESHLLAAVEAPYNPMQWHRDPCNESRVEFLLADGEAEDNAGELRSEEAWQLACRIAEMCSGPNPAKVCGEDNEVRPARYGDVAILFRSTSSLYIYERALQEAGVPYFVEAGPAFYVRQEVLDFRNLLASVADPWNEMALVAFLRSPLAGVSDDALLRLALNGRISAAFWAGRFDGTGEDAGRLEYARTLLEDLRQCAELPLPVFVRRALEQSGAEAIWLSQFLGAQKAANVRKLVDLADSFARTRPPRLTAFMRYLDSMVDREVREGEAALSRNESGAVRLMTIHKSKGLEFPIVVLPDMGRKVEGGRRNAGIVHSDRNLGLVLLPVGDDGERLHPFMDEAIRTRQSAAEEAESNRLLYVALTRARDYLLLSGSPQMKSLAESWLGEFDAVYSVCDQTDGHEFHLEHPSGRYGVRIVRRVNEPSVPPPSAQQAPKLDVSAVTRRAEPLAELPATFSSISVTALAKAMAGSAAETEPESPEERVEYQGVSTALIRGSAFHDVVADWDFSAPLTPLVSAAVKKWCAVRSQRPSIQQDIESVCGHVKDSVLGKRIAADPDAKREATFLLRVDDTMVDGAIDVLLGDGTVIDYKTGRFDPEKHAAYTYQVQLYALAVREVYGQIPSEGWLYYVDENRIEPVDVGEFALAGVLSSAKEAVQRLATAVPV